jgi:signal transduction histidine kinase
VASIRVIQGPDKGRVYELRGGENIVGRQSRTVHITDGTVSRHHAKLSLANGHWVLEDMGSGNGTYLNGLRMTAPSPVKRGDQIRCGSTLLVFGVGEVAPVDVDENGRLVDAAIVARLPSSEDSIIIPTPEAGQQAITSLRQLYDFISEISTIFDVDALLERVLDKVFEVVQADRGYIMLIDERGKLTPKASHLTENSPSKDLPISRTIINEVVGRQVGVLSSNAMGDRRFASGKSVYNFGIRSAICVPIKGRQRILGVIHVDCSVSEHTYTTEQLRLLTAIGYQTGLAIDNVNLYKQAVQSERLRAMGEAVAFMSHHIKNLLQALSAGIDVVEMGLDRDDLSKAKRSWPVVRRNIGRVNELMLNMLAYSKDREPLLENVNLNHVVSECIELQSPLADEREIAILTDLDDIPAIPADASGLRQALTNLLTNALDAVAEHHGAITVSTRYDADKRQVAISVADNGAGIPRAQMEEIFRPFWSSKGQKGTGLGLAVAKKIAEEHDGAISVRSRSGEGSTFTILLPATQDADADDTSTPGTR